MTLSRKIKRTNKLHYKISKSENKENKKYNKTKKNGRR